MAARVGVDVRVASRVSSPVVFDVLDAPSGWDLVPCELILNLLCGGDTGFDSVDGTVLFFRPSIPLDSLFGSDSTFSLLVDSELRARFMIPNKMKNLGQS